MKYSERKISQCILPLINFWSVVSLYGVENEKPTDIIAIIYLLRHEVFFVR